MAFMTAYATPLRTERCRRIAPSLSVVIDRDLFKKYMQYFHYLAVQ